LALDFNQKHKGSRNPDHRLVGILIEAKDSQMYRDMYGLEIGETILQTLRKYKLDTIENATKYCPIYLHSFDYGTVKYWASHTELPRNFLLFTGSPFNLTDIALYATGIGFQDGIIWDYKNKKPFTVHTDTQALGMLVHVWTFRDDDNPPFNATNNIVSSVS
jgi:glycerophosphoryl diester phosphodiesterase